MSTIYLGDVEKTLLARSLLQMSMNWFPGLCDPPNIVYSLASFP